MGISLDLYALDIPPGLQTWLFLAFTVAFAIKVPVFPFHTWLPDAHVQVPTAGSDVAVRALSRHPRRHRHRLWRTASPPADSS